MEVIKKNPKHRKKSKGKISFDEEVVTKDCAKQIVSEEQILSDKIKTKKGTSQSKQNKKRKNGDHADLIQSRNKEKKEPKKKKQKLNNDSVKTDKTDLPEPSEKSELSQDPGNGKSEKKESIRALKRKKHAKLMEEKKIKVDTELQKKALNYLSKWKHSKSEWKFEKLKQVWLQQNLFDKNRIPNEFWDTAVQYFSGSKGQSRQSILDQAIKCIEEEEKHSEGDIDEDYQSKLKRARDVVQNLE